MTKQGVKEDKRNDASARYAKMRLQSQLVGGKYSKLLANVVSADVYNWFLVEERIETTNIRLETVCKIDLDPTVINPDGMTLLTKGSVYDQLKAWRKTHELKVNEIQVGSQEKLTAKPRWLGVTGSFDFACPAVFESLDLGKATKDKVSAGPNIFTVRCGAWRCEPHTSPVIGLPTLLQLLGGTEFVQAFVICIPIEDIRKKGIDLADLASYLSNPEGIV